MKYGPSAVLNWFHRTLGVDGRPQRDEILTKCPECGSEVFYFNIRKQVGICHRASCGITPSLDDLIEIVGFPPNEEGSFDREEEQKQLAPLDLPGWPVAQMINGQLMTTNAPALEYLRSRGLSDQIIVNWGITCDGERVFVPIRSGGVLVNYNSRLLPGCPGRKYLYAKGRSTGNYILGWEEACDWTRLCLVENTFVSLWLRSDLHCTTTFGSNISDVQASLIGGSRVKAVAVLWDERAERSAERGVRKLHEKGLNAAYWSILGQPDDYPKEVLSDWAKLVFEAAENGIPEVDLKEECKRRAIASK